MLSAELRDRCQKSASIEYLVLEAERVEILIEQCDYLFGHWFEPEEAIEEGKELVCESRTACHSMLEEDCRTVWAGM